MSQHSITWVLTSDGPAAPSYLPVNYITHYITIYYAVRRNSGVGTCSLEVSYDEGVSWESLEGSSKTNTGQATFSSLPVGILVRPSMSGGVTPNFTVRVYSI